MTAAYSASFRLRLIESYDEGVYTQQEVSDNFGIHLSTFKRIYKRYRETGKATIQKSNAGRPTLIDQSGYKYIQKEISTNPSITLEEIQKRYYKHKQVKVSIPTICRALQHLSLNRKKISHYAQEQDREDVKKKTSVYRR